MKTLIGILFACYFFAVVPFLAGVFWDSVTKVKEHRIVRAWINGYVAMLAAFWCVAFVLLFRGCTLKRLSAVWLAVSVLICLVGLIAGRKQLLSYGRHAVMACQKSTGVMRVVFAVSVILLLFSVMFVEPRIEPTVETVATSVATDTTYMYQPYTGEQFPSTQADKIISPYEMLYAPMVLFSGAKAGFLIKIVLPFFLIPFFYGVYSEIGRELFKDHRGQAVFLLIAEALYTVPVYTAVNTSVAGIFQNCWHGEVLLNSCVLPFAFLQILKIANRILHKTSDCRHRERMEYPGIHAAGVFLCAYPAAQLCTPKGWFYLLLMTILMVVVVIVRKGCEYVSIMDRR